MLHLMTVIVSVQEQYYGRESKMFRWFRLVMTVQELIDELMWVKDKSKTVYGLSEIDCFSINGVLEDIDVFLKEE